jgi:DNA-binding helix-hairpin-helix protein with protein kinase domain
MTTKRSSLHPTSPAKADVPVELVDSRGQSVRLGRLIGRGGQGSVYAIEGEPSLAAKVYHESPLPADIADKLPAVLSCRTKEIDAIAAWPQALLFDRRRQVRGVLLPLVATSHHLHEVYGTSNRRRHFPDAQWHHLVLAARNVAAAFESLHKASIVVGDVNQGNLLIDRQMRVRFIDCDSFQISAGDKTYLCPVATPHFTPPELQAKKLRETPRTPAHDRFGLAVLLFHLLFVGRHPFAGRYYGTGELTIEKAIAERRFAFSKDKATTLVEPPPASLLLDDLPASLGALFERAFRVPEPSARPTALAWVQELEALLRQRKTCQCDPAHVYYSGLAQCPWCRIEDEGGPTFFLSSDSGSMAPLARLDNLEEKLRQLMVPAYPSLPAGRMQAPPRQRARRSGPAARFSAAEAGAALMAIAVVLCLLAGTSVWTLAAGASASLIGAAILLISPGGRSRRATAWQLEKRLEEMKQKLAGHAQKIKAGYQKRRGAFDSAVAEVKAECDHFCDADTKLENVLVLHRVSQLKQYLSQQLIGDHIQNISGMTRPMASVLQSYGVESAADVEPLKLLGVPMLTPGLTMELTVWREAVEQQFVFKPEHGVTLDYASAAGDAAVRRFKVFLARKILMAAKQLESLGVAGREQLNRELALYDEEASHTRDVAYELRDYQGSRRWFERLLNHSPAIILVTAFTTCVAGGLVYLLFG